jgi:hypothetical protein
MIELEFCELHASFFMAGTNLPAKIIPGDGPGKRRDIKIFYDRKHREIHVHFKGKVAIIPRENVACMVEKGEKVEKEETPPNEIPFEIPFTPVKAQYDTPMSHVFSGPGGGKVR